MRQCLSHLGRLPPTRRVSRRYPESLAIFERSALLVQGVDASLLRPDVVATDEDVLTGDRFVRIYGMQAGERFEIHPR